MRKHYYQAVEGDKSAAAKAVGIVERMLGSQPGDPLLLAYRGSLFLLESSWAMAPWSKGKLAKEGIAMLDRAVTSAPDNLEVRFVRGASTRRLPGFFKKADESAADLAKVASEVGEIVRTGAIEPKLATAALYYHALNRARVGDHASAQEVCTKAIRIGPGTSGAEACRMKFPNATSR